MITLNRPDFSGLMNANWFFSKQLYYLRFFAFISGLIGKIAKLLYANVIGNSLTKKSDDYA